MVLLHLYQENKTEQAIRIFKNNLKAGSATLNLDFPVHKRDQLIPQVELTINLLQASRLNPKLSVWAFLHEQFDGIKNFKPHQVQGLSYI